MNDFSPTFLAEVFCTFSALSIALSATAKAQAGGIDRNKNGGRAGVMNRGHDYSPRSYYNYGPRYYRVRRIVAAPIGACARGYYGHGGCIPY